MVRVITLISVALVTCACSQVQARKRAADSTYVRGFPQTITVRTYLGEKISTFRLIDNEANRNIQFRPNNILGLGLGVTIRGIGLNFSTSLPFHDKKVDQFGATKRIDVQVHRYARKLMLDAYFQRYTGFHLNDKSEVTTIIGPEEFPYFPHMQALTIGASGLYVFNGERFSLRAISNQQEWQLRSSGSPLLGASIFSHLFKNEEIGIIPQYYKYPEFLGGRRPKEIHYYGLSVNAGYAYTQVIGAGSHFFLTGAADVGGGPGYSSIVDMKDDKEHHFDLSITTNVRVGAGYNSKDWFAGIYGIYHTDRFQLPYDKAALGTSQGIIRFVIARRITTRKPYLSKQKEIEAQQDPK